MEKNGLSKKLLLCLMLVLCAQGCLFSQIYWSDESYMFFYVYFYGEMWLEPRQSTQHVTNRSTGAGVSSVVNTSGEFSCATLRFKNCGQLKGGHFRITRVRGAFLSNDGSSRLPYALRMSVGSGASSREVLSKKEGPYVSELFLLSGEVATFSVILDPVDYNVAACGSYSEEIKVEIMGR
jgi:hypothetical protein